MAHGVRGRVAVMTTAVVGVLGIALVAGCAGTSPDERREAVVYEEIVRWLLEERIGDELDPTTPLFFDSLGTEGIALEVQVEMIELLDDFENVRFIDEHEEAIDIDDPARAVHQRGVLIGLGAVPAEGSTIVRAEIYRTRDDRSALRFELVGNGSTWDIVPDPESIPVEELTGDLDGD